MPLAKVSLQPDSQSEPASVKSAAQAFWEERLRDNLNESGTGCSGVGLQFNRWLYRLRSCRFKTVLSGLNLEYEKIRVLDVGCGAGFYIRQWTRLGVNRLEGLDFSQSAIKYLQTTYPHCRFHLEDISDPDLVLPAEPYDIISAFDVLFHIVNDENYLAALNNLRRMLKPGGMLILSENFTHHEHTRGGDYHYSRTLPQIERMLLSAGFQLCYRRPMFVLMNAPDDSSNRFLRAWWRVIRSLAQRGEVMGWLTGALLYPPERLLTSLLKESPTTEIAVCKRMRDRIDEQEHD